MPRNGSGTYNAPDSTWSPAVPNTPMLSDDWNTLLQDLSTAISGSIASDGQTTLTAPLSLTLGARLGSGSVSTPSLSFISDTSTGIYRPGSGQWGLAVGGVSVMTATSTGVTFPLGVTFGGNPSFTGNVTIGDAAGDTLTINSTTTFAVTPVVPNGSFTNAKLANVATQTIKGRTTSGTGAPEDLTATQATAILNSFVADTGSGGTKGLVPAPAPGDAAAIKFLGADGTWQSVLKGWAVVTGSSGAVVRGYNIGVTRTGAGIYTVAFTSALPDANYAVFLNVQGSSAVTGFPWGAEVVFNTKTASGFTVYTQSISATPAPADPQQFYIAVVRF